MTFNINAQVRLHAPTNAAQIAAQLRQQLQSVTATVNVNVSARGQSNMNKANKSLKNTAKSAKAATSGVKSLGESMAFAGKRFFAFTIATGAILKFASALKEGVSGAIDFQREVVKISQVTGTSTKGLKSLSNEVTRLSTKYGVSSKELLKASRVLSQTGLAADKVEISLQALAKSDLAPTFDNINSTTEGTIAIFRQFGIEVDQLESKLGSINAVSKKFAVESSDIIAAVRRTGGAFSAAGGDLEDLIALFTSVRATTRESAESIATGFRTIFTRMQRVSTQNFLGTLGIELQNLEGQFVGPYEAVRRLSTALETLPSTDPRFAQIIEELGGFRQVSKVIPLIQQFTTAERARAVAVSGTNSLTEDAAKAQEALSIQITKTKQNFEKMIRTFVDTASFQGAVQILLKLADALVKVGEALAPLIPLLGILGGIGLAKLIPGVMKGFNEAGGFGIKVGRFADGGPVRKFARGGVVPGVGNTDSVPARLTPGEFVLRKSAVQRIGVDNIQHLASGGSVKEEYQPDTKITENARIEAAKKVGSNTKKSGYQNDYFGTPINQLSGEDFGVVFAEKRGNSQKMQPEVSVANVTAALERQNQGWMTENYVKLGGSAHPSSNKKYNVSLGYINPKAAKLIGDDTKPYVEETMQQAGRSLVSPGTQLIKGLPIPGWPVIQGLLFEGIVARMGSPYNEAESDALADDRRGWDFPSGLKGAAKGLFDNTKLGGGFPVDAKKSLINADIKGKIENTIADKILEGSGNTYDGFTAYKGRPGQIPGGTLHSDRTEPPRVIPPKNKAMGGPIGSDINAMLTPGEVVIGADDASRIGASTLNHANRTGQIPGFAQGGFSKGFKPKLTTRGKSGGNVGRKKQYYSQLIDHLKTGKTQGLLDPAELRMLRQLQLRVSTIQASRTKRFSKRLGFNQGGAVGNIKRYAGGGGVRRYASGGGFAGGIANNFGAIGFGIAGIAALASSLKGLSNTVDGIIDGLTRFGSQAALLFFTFKAATSTIGKFDKKIAAAEVAKEQLQEQKPASQARVKAYDEEIAAVQLDIDERKRTGRPQRGRRNTRRRLQAERKEERLRVPRLIREQNNTIKSQRRMATMANIAGASLAAFGAVVDVWAQSVIKAGRADLEAGLGSGTYVRGKALEGSSRGLNMGGLIGGAIGTIIAPGVGTAIGASLGATAGISVGGAYGASVGQEEADNILAMQNFTTQLKDVTYRLEGLAKGTTTLDRQMLKIQQFVGTTRNQLSAGDLTTEGRGEVLNQSRQQLEGLNSYFAQIAKSTDVSKLTDIDAGFAKFLDMAGDEVFRFTARLSNLSYKQLEANIKAQIESYQNATKAQEKINALNLVYADRVRNILNVSRAFTDVTMTMERFDAAVGTAVGSFKVLDESARLGKPSDFFDLESFKAILNRDVTNNPLLNTTFPDQPSTVGASLSDDIEAANKTVREMPAVLLRLKNSIGSFSPENAVGKLISEFDDAPKFVRDALERAAEGIIGSEGKEEKLIDSLRNDFSATVEKLGAGFKPLFDTVAKVSKAMTTEANRRLAYVNKLTELIDAEVALRQQGSDIRAEAEGLSATVGARPTDKALLQQLDRQKLQDTLVPIGGGSTDPNQLGTRLAVAKARLDALNVKLAKDGIDINGKLNKEIIQQSIIVKQTTKALEYLSDISGRAAVTMQEFEVAQKAASFKTGLVDRALAIEEPAQGRDMFLELGAARAAANAGSLDVIPRQLRSEVLNLFKSLGPGTLDVLGGKSGEDVLRGFREDFIRNAANQTGTPLTEDDITKLAAGRSSETEKLGQRLEKFTQDAIKANAALSKQTNTAMRGVSDSFAESVIKFEKSIENIFKRQKEEELLQTRAGKEGELANTTTSLVNAQRFNSRFGQGPAGLDEKRASSIGENLGLIKEVFDQRELKASLDSFVERQRAADVGTMAATDTELFGKWFDRIKFSGNAYGVKVGQAGTADGLTNTGTLQDYIKSRPIADAPFGSTGVKNEGRISTTDYRQAVKDEAARIKAVTGSADAADTFTQKMHEAEDTTLEFSNGSTDALRFAQALTVAHNATASFAAAQYDALEANEANLIAQGLNLTATEIRMVGEEYGAIQKQWEQFKDAGTISDLQLKLGDLTGNITDLNTAIEKLDLPKTAADAAAADPTGAGSQRGGLIGFNKGGVVPGYGNRDSVHAMLTPGEVVLPKMAAGGTVKTIEELMAEAQQTQAIASKDRAKKTYASMVDTQELAAVDRRGVVRKHDNNAELVAFNRNLVYGGGYYDSEMARKQKERLADSEASLRARLTGEGYTAPVSVIDQDAIRERRAARAERNRNRTGRISYANRNKRHRLSDKERAENAYRARVNASGTSTKSAKAKFGEDLRNAPGNLARGVGDALGRAKDFLGGLRDRPKVASSASPTIPIVPSAAPPTIPPIEQNDIVEKIKKKIEENKRSAKLRIEQDAYANREQRSTPHPDNIASDARKMAAKKAQAEYFDKMDQQGRDAIARVPEMTEAPTTIGGIASELYEAYKIGKRGANWVSSGDPDYVFGLGNVAEFVGTGEILSGGLGLLGKLYNSGRGAKAGVDVERARKASQQSTNAKRAQQASQAAAARAAKEHAAFEAVDKASKAAAHAAAKAERVRKAAEAAQATQSQARAAAATAAKAEQARQAANAAFRQQASRAAQAAAEAEQVRKAAQAAQATQSQARAAAAAATKADQARKATESATRAAQARQAATAASEAATARKAAQAAQAANAARAASASAKPLQKMSSMAAKRLMDTLTRGARAAGTAEAEATGQAVAGMSKRFGLSPEHLAKFSNITARAANAGDEGVAKLMLDRLLASINKANGFQSGAFVPGVGSGDKIRALLEPGEFVMNRNAVKAAGASNLDSFNKKHSRFQTGGAVGMQDGGGTAGTMAAPDFAFFDSIVQKFGNKVDLLAESVNNINGMEIQLTASHKVEVIINGAQILQQLQPSIANLVVAETNKAINTMLKSKFPDVGTMD